MDDRQIEQLMQRYRPVGPPPGLRGRVLQASAARRVWPWAVAASLALAGTMALQILSGRVRDRIDVGVNRERDEPIVQALSDMLGGDDIARRLAETDLARTRAGQAEAARRLPAIDTDTP